MTIFWAVISIIISSVKRHSWKRMAHICEKILEFLPSSADSYAPSAIILESSTTSIIASLMHSAPYLINLLSLFPLAIFPPIPWVRVLSSRLNLQPQETCR